MTVSCITNSSVTRAFHRERSHCTVSETVLSLREGKRKDWQSQWAVEPCAVLSLDERYGTLACIGSELADVDVEDSQHLIATEGEKGMCSVHPSEAVFKCTE